MSSPQSHPECSALSDTSNVQVKSGQQTLLIPHKAIQLTIQRLECPVFSLTLNVQSLVYPECPCQVRSSQYTLIIPHRAVQLTIQRRECPYAAFSCTIVIVLSGELLRPHITLMIVLSVKHQVTYLLESWWWPSVLLKYIGVVAAIFSTAFPSQPEKPAKKYPPHPPPPPLEK